MEKYPNWLEMPDEQMVNIFQRLRTVQLLKSARKVCTNWRRICKDPAVWKVINIDKSVDACDGHYDLEKVTKEAVDLSCGELIDITINDSATDDLLDHIVQRSSKLKRLCLNCSKMSGIGLTLAVKRLPQLEELHIKLLLIDAELIGDIGRNCPQLKSFMMDKGSIWLCLFDDDAHALAIAKSMPQLRHLQLLGYAITDNALQAIRNGCPHLQSLDVQRCSNFGENLLKQSIERIKDFNMFAGDVDEDNFSEYFD